MTPIVRALQLLAATLALTVVAACGGTTDDNPGTHTGKAPDVKDRPSMETMIKRYEGMRTEIFAALAEEFGARGWKLSPDNDEFDESFCPDVDPKGEIRYFPTYMFPGTYDAADWKASSALVERIGREHGFDDAAVVVDKPGNYELVGEDDFGGRYTFGMATNTIFGLQTGCHRWDDKPSTTP